MAKTTATPAEENQVIAARNKNLDMVLQTIVKEYGDGAIMRLGDAKQMDVEVIPTGNILIDRALGCGGENIALGCRLIGDSPLDGLRAAETVAADHRLVRGGRGQFRLDKP